MKEKIHPKMREVVFQDQSTGDTFIALSTLNPKDTITVDGTKFPVMRLEISSASHPFYTGKAKLVDTAGRIEKYKRRYQTK